MESKTVKKRIEYIDAMRGFTMLLVVFSHVEIFSFDLLPNDSILNSIFILFRMPLFFFVSGFLAYKSMSWTGSVWLSATRKKLYVQIIPTLVFGCLYTFAHSHTVHTFLIAEDKLGYWFTISLFEMFTIYYTINYIAYKCGYSKTGGSTYAVLVIVAVISYLAYFVIGKIPAFTEISDYFSLSLTFVYFQFFVLGNIAASHPQQFCKLLDNKYFIGCVICMFSVGSIVNMGYLPLYALGALVSKLLRIIAGLCANYCGLLIVFVFFRRYQSSFTSSSRIGSGLQYIGRRTLDIYLLHFFFLPTLPCVGDFLRGFPNLLLELFSGLTLSLLVTGLCILVSNIIRTSDILGHWLFGAKTG